MALSLYFGEYYQLHNFFHERETCSRHLTGYTHHLGWNFRVSNSDYFPNGLAWFYFGQLPLLFFRPIFIGWSLFIYGMTSFTLVFNFMQQQGEYSMSLYCWVGILLSILFTLEPYFVLFMGSTMGVSGRWTKSEGGKLKEK